MKRTYNINIFLLIALFWASLLISINTKPHEVQYFGENLIASINAFRIFFPIFLIVLFLILISYLLIIKKYDKNIFLDPINLFFFYFLFQLIGLYQNNGLKFNLDNTYLLILGLGVLEIILIIKLLKLEKNLKHIFYISILIICITASLLFILKIKDFDIKETLYLYYYIGTESKFLDQEYPRITGLSRMLALINLYLITIFFFKRINIFYKALTFFLIYLLSLLIWGMQSRGTIICFFGCVLTIIFFLKKFNFYYKFLVFLLFIVAPIISYQFFIFNYQNINKISSTSSSSQSSNSSSSPSSNYSFLELTKNSRIIKEHNTSGRTGLWNETLSKYNKQKIFGYGPQADRFLIGLKEYGYFGNNVSNAYVYAFLCGGYLSIIILIFITITAVFYLYKIFFIKKIFSEDNLIYVKLSSIYLIFFLLRSIIENSFSLFSIDFIFFIISMSILKYFIKFKKII